MFEKLFDTKKLVFRIWICLWIILAIMVIFKFCFNIWYPIVEDNKYILAISRFIYDNWVVKTIIMYGFYILNINLWILISILSKKYSNKKILILIQFLMIIGFTIKNFNNTYGCIFELLYLVIIPIIINLKRNINKLFSIIFPIVIYLMINIWQLNIGFIRGIDNVITNLPFIISFYLQIDYYIFILNTWIGVSFMGLWGGGWLWGKSLTELKAMKEKELAKENPDAELIAEIDKAIAKKETKGE